MNTTKNIYQTELEILEEVTKETKIVVKNIMAKDNGYKNFKQYVNTLKMNSFLENAGLAFVELTEKEQEAYKENFEVVN